MYAVSQGVGGGKGEGEGGGGRGRGRGGGGEGGEGPRSISVLVGKTERINRCDPSWFCLPVRSLHKLNGGGGGVEGF